MEISLKLTPIQYLFFLILFPGCRAAREDCKPFRCSDQGPEIGYPFWVVTKQPKHCGYPGYELYCNHLNQTMLDLPVSVKVVVKEINYTSQTIDVYDPHSCLPRQLLSLNLSAASPIRFLPIGRLSFVAFFNCPPPERTFGHLVPCLGVGDYRVYAITDGSFVDIYDLTSCIKIHKISPATIDMIPIQPDMYEREKNIRFAWITPDCWSCEANGNICSVWDYNTPGLPAYECLDTLTAVASKKPVLAGSSKKLLVTGVVVGTIFFALVIIAFYRAYTLNKMRKQDQVKIETFLEDYEALNPTRYTFADIKKITNQFKYKLGEGGYGTVFKGNLSSEVFVAVKVLNISIGNGEDFINEVRTMGRIHHVNVVRFVGFCADGIRRALVYEFLPNESLEKFIFSKIVYLGWEKLRDIALGIAKGIEYLHQGCDHQILHFDIKPHNILLDQNFNPKIADFGLAKLCSKEQSVVSMTAARGTMGYIAPEVFSRNFGNVSYKSDVYSFGMMLLEMVGGRKNIDVTINNASQAYFPEWIYNRLYRGEELRIRIANEEHRQIAKKLTVVALWCIQWSPLDRPSMKTVVQMLEDKGDALTIPPNPFGSIIQSKSSNYACERF